MSSAQHTVVPYLRTVAQFPHSAFIFLPFITVSFLYCDWRCYSECLGPPPDLKHQPPSVVSLTRLYCTNSGLVILSYYPTPPPLYVFTSVYMCYPHESHPLPGHWQPMIVEAQSAGACDGNYFRVWINGV